MSPREIIVVAGLPRSGTSLALQMLHAAGVRCAGEWPGFEPEEILSHPDDDFMARQRGGAIKLLDPHRIYLPGGFSYRFLFMTRSRRQQARSHAKFLRIMHGIPEKSVPEMDLMEQGLKEEERCAWDVISLHGAPMHPVRFEDLIERPEETVHGIAGFIGLGDKVEAMRACIRPRRATCYPGMLEFELMESEAAP